MNDTVCPLCDRETQVEDDTVERRDALGRQIRACQTCEFYWVPRKHHLSVAEERARYDTHQNSPEAIGYRRFLSQLTEPLVKSLPAEAFGLDFGSGPGPALSILMREQGYEVANYDPLYQPDRARLTIQYDFVTATEVIEHFRAPRQDWATLLRLVKPGGLLGIMTDFVEEPVEWVSWYYARDPSHLAFYTRSGLERYLDSQGFQLELNRKRAAIFRKMLHSMG